MNEAQRRPSPDALLAEARRAGRGRLKVFLGAAPGVGKTYEMLTEARQRRADGIDVVIGIVETHGREDTRRLADSLPSLPRRRLTYQGQQFQELDLDALLERKPQLALVDELAHSNIPGSRHEKRWQDIEELLEAGIDVYTTLNVQHLSSLVDVVEKIARVRVRETVPDTVLELADQIELIDIPADDLIKRLHEGKVYVPDVAEQAVQHFFSRGNLTALRELAMRAAAERVDADVVTWMQARAVEGPWATQERLMVLIGDSPDSLRLVRLGKRLADRRNASWIVTHVARASFDSDPGNERVLGALALAEELGAQTLQLTGQDLVAEILSSAAERNVTQIIVGRSRRPWRHLALRPSLAAALLRQARNIDITVASEGAEADGPVAARQPAPDVAASGWRGYFEAVLLTAGCGVIARLLEPLLVTANLGLVFLTGVLFAAMRAGVGPALLASTLGFLVFNFFFTEPLYTLLVANEQDLLTLLFFLVVAIVTGQLAARVRRQMAAIRSSNRRAELLYDFSRRLGGAVGRDDLAWVLCNYVSTTLAVDTIVLLRNYESRLVVVAGEVGREGLSEAEQMAAEWAMEHREPAGRSTGTLPSGRWMFVPLPGGKGALGVLGIGLPSGRALDPERRRLLFAMRDQAAVALEKLQLTGEIQRGRLLTETDKLRAALLSSVSHDLRTPLVSIKGTATALLDLDQALDPRDKRELLEDVVEQSERLNRYVQNLLDMTRLGYGTLVASRDWCDFRDIAAAAMQRLKNVLARHPVNIAVADGEALVHTDPNLLEQVLLNLLDNAAKYSPAGTTIDIEAGPDGGDYRIAVCDAGPGIPAAERENIFDMFHRVHTKGEQVGGAGLGLAICKGIVEALGGTIRASGGLRGVGTRIEIVLSQPPDTPPRGGQPP